MSRAIPPVKLKDITVTFEDGRILLIKCQSVKINQDQNIEEHVMRFGDIYASHATVNDTKIVVTCTGIESASIAAPPTGWAKPVEGAR